MASKLQIAALSLDVRRLFDSIHVPINGSYQEVTLPTGGASASSTALPANTRSIRIRSLTNHACVRIGPSPQTAVGTDYFLELNVWHTLSAEEGWVVAGVEKLLA